LAGANVHVDRHPVAGLIPGAALGARGALVAVAVVAFALGCGEAEGARRKDAPVGTVQHGTASYYGKGFVGKRTASGERFDPNAMTAAHKTLPFGTRVRVTRVGGRSVTVRVNDRCGCTHGRLIDLSEGAARKLDMIKVGVVDVRLEILGKNRIDEN